MKTKIFIMMMMMLLLVTTLVSARPPTEDLIFNQGLTLTLDSIDEHTIHTDLTLYSGVYDTLTGVKQDNTTICSVDLLYIEDGNISLVYAVTDFTYENNVYTLRDSLFNKSGTYKAEFWCHNSDNTKGGYTSQSFEVAEKTIFGFWKPVTNWTFPIIYLLLSFLFILFAISYESSLLGVIGGIMLFFSYFIVGATAPLLFTPLLIIGLLLSFKFASL